MDKLYVIILYVFGWLNITYAFTHPVIASLGHPLSASGKRIFYFLHPLCAAERVASPDYRWDGVS